VTEKPDTPAKTLTRKSLLRSFARWLAIGVVLIWSLAAMVLLAARWIDPPSTAVHRRPFWRTLRRSDGLRRAIREASTGIQPAATATKYGNGRVDSKGRSPTTANQGLLLPLRPGATFSFVDRDLIYGTSDPDTLTITSYRFSTNASTRAVADVSATLPTCRQVCPPTYDFLLFISNDFLVVNGGPVHACIQRHSQFSSERNCSSSRSGFYHKAVAMGIEVGKMG
jgi:hypothetical protein